MKDVMGLSMLCERCNQNEATVHFTEVVNGVRSEHHLCGGCASEFNMGLDGEFSFARLLTGLFAAAGRGDGESERLGEEVSDPMEKVVCPGCGMNFREFTSVGKFGCGECYGVFGPLIDDNMKKIHGDSRHKGKVYAGAGKEERSVAGLEPQLPRQEEILRAKLKEAIAMEEYEEAARLRDEIKLLKEGV